MKIRLADGGKTLWTLVLGTELSETERFAAEELISHFREMTGITLRTKADRSPCTPYEICIGHGRHAALATDIGDAEFGLEDFALSIHADRIVIVGNRCRGTLYGVYEFLEEDLGIRWYTPDFTHIPCRSRVEVEERSCVIRPALEYRETLCVHQGFGDPIWYVRNRLNRAMATPLFGGGVQWAGKQFCHTFHSFVSPEEYYDEHPEYFAWREDKGCRVTGRRAQLCLTNPDVLDIVIGKTKQWLRDNPGANIVSISQMDATKPEDILYCQCPSCKALDEQEGTQAGSILHFVNAVADAIRDEFPYASVDTIAYSYTTAPPKHVKVRDNVILRPCFNGDLLDEWYKVGKRLFIWDYVTNFRHYTLPFPNYDYIESHIRGLMKHKVRGIFIQSTYDTRGTDFNELKCWLYAKLLWNPEKEISDLIPEFMTAYFETAAPPLMQYLDLLRERIRMAGKPPACFVNLPVFYIDNEVLRTADVLFNRAEKLACSEEILARVRRMRLSVRFVELMYMDPADPRRPEMVDAYFDDLAELGVDRISERNELVEAKDMVMNFTGLYELSEALPGAGYSPDQI